MWRVISRVFNKKNGKCGADAENPTMDKNDSRTHQEDNETYGNRQAKQRATVKWMLSKAFNNRVPENLQEPFYRNHEDQEHLKPQLVHLLANAELYCMALSNIYSDPNYNNLNHWGVLQALARKGVHISDPHITETVLIQTTPLKMSAHQMVMQAVMTLYAKEVATPEFVYAAVKRLLPPGMSVDPPQDFENALLFWINQVTSALKTRLEHEDNGGHKCPEFPKANSLQDLCDGSSLAALVSFYCPEELHWSSIVVSQLPNVSDCVRNLSLVSEFCSKALPSNIFHMAPEDIYYMRGSMKHNLVVFLADLFNLLEIHPAPCVTLNSAMRTMVNAEGRNSQGVPHKRSLPQAVSAIPDLRSGINSPSSFTGSPIVSSGSLKKNNSGHQLDTFNDSRHQQGGGDDFVVHRGRGVPTLSSVINSGSNDHHRSEQPVAGKPTNWEPRKPSYAGRRSRRNSLSDDSQLTLENFGGSQENLHLLGRNPDKEPAVHTGRRESVSRSSISDNNSDALHNALQDNSYTSMQASVTAGKPSCWDSTKPATFAGRRSRRNSLADDSQLTVENFGGSQDNLQFLGRNPDKEPVVHIGRRDSLVHGSNDALHRLAQAPEAPFRATLSRSNSFLENQKRAEETRSSAGLQQLLLDPPSSPPPPIPETRPPEREKKVTTFAALPNNTTTWQQQCMANQNNEHQDNGANDPVDNGVMSSQLMNIRLKLEEKRRRIESEKRRMEAQLNRQRQKVGKAAFLQAVTKGKAVKSPDSDPGTRETLSSEGVPNDKPARPFSLQDITEVEQKWLSGDGFTEERKTPDVENLDIETYQQSIAQMNSSLHEISADLQRLANQQNQLQNNVGPQNNISNMHGGQSPMVPPQQQHQPPPQLQSFASLHHNNSTYSTQHINFNNQPPNCSSGPMMYPNQQPTPPGYPNHEYFNGQRSMGYNSHLQQQQQQAQQQQQMQQMHSLMSTGNSQQQYNNQQQWHSLNQQQPPPPQSNYNTYTPSPRYNQGFNLHNYDDGYSTRQESQPTGEFYLHEPVQIPQRRNWGQPFSPDSVTWSNVPRRETSSLSSSPKQPHYLQNGGGSSEGGSIRTAASPSLSTAPTPPPRTSVNHAPLPAPPADDMEPQSISFIGSGEDEQQLTPGLSKLNITSGSRTYRIPSPTRTYTPVRNSFSQQQLHEKPEKGFYISFDDNEPPKRPKPPLRTKRMSPKKERSLTQTLESSNVNSKLLPSADDGPLEALPTKTPPPSRVSPPEPMPPPRNSRDATVRLQPVVHHQPVRHHHVNAAPVAEPKPIVIGANTDPGELDEMEKKKERILMLSLQRRQAAEEARNRKEMEAARRREEEKLKEEEKLRKKEEEKRRRAIILEQYKIKKAIEEAEREGKQVDKELLNSWKNSGLSAGGSAGSSSSSVGGPPRMRSKPAPSRPRPRTIHVDSGADAHDGTMSPSRGKKGSSSNLSAFNSTMRRDYYRGSQDCLTETRKPSSSSRLYSTDPSPEVRTMGRSKYGTYQARRKSNSLMNLAGSSCDQDSLAYRYGDTDSGLGRATPPRRVPSPSGPGSLPLRRRFDDNMSDAGSDYNGPRLYKQPATKSNKGIVLNAVEYCVFPGVVNQTAKCRVIEEMNRSEAKHFLVLFRDAGCQFRALYEYYPESEEIVKLYGTGPKQVTDRMFDKFFKYNSGGKCFSQVHTKHLTVTIDAFTIHNSLWQGKKVNLPSKRDMALVV